MKTYCDEQIDSVMEHPILSRLNGIIKIKIVTNAGETNYINVDNDKAAAILKILTGKDYS